MRPVGPLAPQVYWRRRAGAVAGVVLAVVLLVWLVSAATGGSTPQPSAQQVPVTPSTSTPAPTTAPSPATTTTVPAAAAVPTATAPATVPATTPATASTKAPATGAATKAPAAAAPAATAPTCPDTAIRVTAQVAQPSYVVGQLPVFRVVITNTGTSACARDLDAALQSAVVYAADGTTRLWSSNDCFPGKTADRPTLAPGAARTYSVKWSGTSSEPTCTADRTQVGAGTYQVVVTLGALKSAPVPFTLTAAPVTAS